MTPDLPARWLKTADAGAHAAFGSAEGFVEWARRVHVVPIRRGRILLWDRLDIDRALEDLKRRQGAGPAYARTSKLRMVR